MDGAATIFYSGVLNNLAEKLGHDFSKEITNVPQGSYTELMLTTAIVNTLREFPEIKKVQILVDGKKIASLKGHTDILDPLERNTTLLKK